MELNGEMRSTTTDRSARLDGLQIARAFAAGSVLVGHAIHEAGSLYGWKAPNLFPWPMGVDVFFAISGFVMVYISRNAFGRPGSQRDFLTRRFLRVAPLYWLFTTLMVAATLIVPHQLETGHFNWPQVIESYFFFPGYARPDGKISPILALGWTINYEIYFYVLFSFVLRFPMRLALTLLCAGLALTVIGGVFVPKAWTPLRFWCDPIVLEFAAGGLVGALFAKGARLPGAARLVLGVGALAWLLGYRTLDLGLPRILGWGVPGLAILVAIALTDHQPRGRLARVFTALGDSSYSLYLSHPFTLQVLAMLWSAAGLTRHAGSPWIYVVTATVAALAGGHISYMLIEKPLLKLTNRFAVRKTHIV